MQKSSLVNVRIKKIVAVTNHPQSFKNQMVHPLFNLVQFFSICVIIITFFVVQLFAMDYLPKS